MYMVIFGAGASYDSVHSRPPLRYPRRDLHSRPPLANELFLDIDLFSNSLRQFPQCKPIVPYLQNIPPESSLEHALELLQTEADSDLVRKRQIASIRYYLHFLIWECERHWSDVAHETTNYVTLLDQLRRCRRPGIPVLLVTFNYDRMLEDALSTVGIIIDDFSKYIQSDLFKLFKLHGSVNWGREVDTVIEGIKDKNVWQVGQDLIEKVDEIHISDRFRMVGSHPIGKIDDIPLFPAIAIPVETKRGFECPSDHLNCFQENLPEVTKILIVGWRATENHFLELLKTRLKGDISVEVVAGQRQYGEEVLSRIHAIGLSVDGNAFDGGFTDYVISRQAEKFFC